MQVEIKCHYQTLSPEVMESVMQAIKEQRAFILAGTRSAVLFDIKTLSAVWIGSQQASFHYDSTQAFGNGVSLQLLSHQQYIDPLDTTKHPTWLKLPVGLLPE